MRRATQLHRRLEGKSGKYHRAQWASAEGEAAHREDGCKAAGRPMVIRYAAVFYFFIASK